MSTLQKVGASLLLVNTFIFGLLPIWDISTGGVDEATVGQFIQLIIALLGAIIGTPALLKTDSKLTRLNNIFHVDNVVNMAAKDMVNEARLILKD